MGPARGEAEEEEEVPEEGAPGLIILLVAVNLHFLNCCGDVPVSLSVLRHMKYLQPDLCTRLIIAPLCMMDGVIIPLSTLVIGSFYLNASELAGEVILRSVELAFVSNIDNLILSLHRSKRRLCGSFSNHTVHIPCDLRCCIDTFNWLICIIPVIPCAYSGVICYLAGFTAADWRV